MNLIKTSYVSFLATFVKILSTLVINKAVAFFIGPQGLALIGQFQNFSQLAMISSQAGINNGVVKYIAEYGDDKLKVNALLGTSFRVAIFFSILTGFIISVLCKIEAAYFLNEPDLYYIFILFGLTIIFFSLNSLILAVLNGLQQIRDYIKINIVQSLVTLVITLILINFLRIQGVLIALVINQSIVFFLLILLLRNHSYLNSNLLRHPFDKHELKKLFKFSFMTVTSSIITPISLIIIRNEIKFKINLEAAGHWQALWYISTMHLMVITTTLSIYYLPKLSSIKEIKLLREEIINGYKIILPTIIISSFSIFLLKDIIVNLLFSKDFEIIKDLLMYQLIGDILKIISWLLSYLMIAKAMAKSFIFTEILFVIIFVLLATYFMNIKGLTGLTYAYIINYILYTIAMIVMFRKTLFHNASDNNNNTII